MRIKKFLAAALGTVMALTTGAISVSADNAFFPDDNMTLVSRERIDNGGLYSIDSFWVSYDGEPFTIDEKGAPTESEQSLYDNDMTLVSCERIDDGELYYIDSFWVSDTQNKSRIYYEPCRVQYRREIYVNDNPEGIKIAEIFAYAVFGYNTEENDVVVAEHDCRAYSVISQEYPKVHEKSYKVENNLGGLFFGKKYAQVEYSIELEIAKGERLLYGVVLQANVEGEPNKYPI